MKKTILLILVISFLQNIINAQCPPYPVEIGCGTVEPNCEGLDGYCNTLVQQTQITEPVPGCGGTAVINNDDWIAFYAGTSAISFQIIPSNCLGAGGNMGIQAGLYAICDPDGGTNGDGQASEPIAVQCGCEVSPFNMTYSNFVVGQIYYLFIDGCGGDICDYEIVVLEGSTTNEEIVEQTGEIQGENSFCSGDIAIFSIDPIDNAFFNNWSVDTTASILNGQGTTEIEVLIETEGSIEICVTPENGCFSGTESCITVNSNGMVHNTTFIENICEGDSIELEGEFYSESGLYFFTYMNIDGCDSTLSFDLTVHEAFETTLDTTLCEGMSIEIGDSIYSQSGLYENLLISSENCDSLVLLNLDIVPVYEIFIQDSICENETYNIWGDQLIAPGVYTNSLESIEGCDSIVMLTLSALPVSTAVVDTAFLSGGFYNGISYDSDTTFVENHISANGCDSLVTINIMVNTIGVSMPQEIDHLSIFPNPANSQLFLSLELNEALDLQLDCYNTLGEKLNTLAFQTLFKEGKHNIELDASQLATGTYFLHFKTEKGNFSKRLVVIR